MPVVAMDGAVRLRRLLENAAAAVNDTMASTTGTPGADVTTKAGNKAQQLANELLKKFESRKLFY